MAEQTTSTDPSPDTAPSELQSFFSQNPFVEFVRLQWIDFTATTRTRLVTTRQALRLATDNKGVAVASPITSAFLIDGSFHQIDAGARDELLPDWSTITVCHYQPGHAAVMCCIDEDSRGSECCPRSVLKKVEREMQDKHGLSFLVGVEIEFYLATSAEATEPVKDVRPYCSTASLRTPYLAVLEDTVRCMERAGIPVWTFHSELVAGLFEISTEPMTPLRMADSLIYIHEAIKTTAVKHGLHATLHPMPFDKTHGVGQHMHISLSSKDKDDSFLAGVLASVPAISAISMPNFDSWLRRDFTGGEWIAWDVENRLATIRKIRGAHWEFRFIDSTTNSYLTLAAILGVGCAAWEQGKPLSMKPMSSWPSELDESGRSESGIKERAPRDLKDALNAIKNDEAVMSALGKPLWERYIKYKEHEEETMKQLTLQERRFIAMQIF